MFYERFKALCKTRGMSPSAVVEAIGINKANASFWKKGSMPSSSNLQKLADYFDVSTDYLLGVNDTVSVDVRDKTLMYDKLTQEESENDKNYLNMLLQEIDTIPEKYKDEAIHELVSIARYILNRYKNLVPEESFIGR